MVDSLGQRQRDLVQRIHWVLRENTPKGFRQTKPVQCNQTPRKLSYFGELLGQNEWKSKIERLSSKEPTKLGPFLPCGAGPSNWGLAIGA